MKRRVLHQCFAGLQSASGWLARPWVGAWREILAAIDACLAAPKRHPFVSLALVLAATGVAWFLYVPVHEMAHVLGCLATGGRVDELQLSPLYGGRVWEKVFPFVKSGSGYAGRLTRFDTRGSDWVYLATDFAPFLLTLAAGMWLLRRASLRGSPRDLGLGAVLTTAPPLSLSGDYYEMGSVIVSGVLSRLPLTLPGGSLDALRSDDLLLLLSRFSSEFGPPRFMWGVLVLLSFVAGCLLAGLTLELSRRVADGLTTLSDRRGALKEERKAVTG